MVRADRRKSRRRVVLVEAPEHGFGFEVNPKMSPHAPPDISGELDEFFGAALTSVDEGEGVLCRQSDPAAGGAPRKTGMFDQPRRRELVAVLPHFMGGRQLVEPEDAENPRRRCDALK